MPVISDNMRGAALMMGSMTAFTVNDAFMKALADELPLFQALFLRGIGVVICLAVLCALMGHLRFDLGRRDWQLITIRSIAETGGAFLFLTALFNMPIANVSAILQALPLTVSLAGALFLGEALGWRRMTAIIIGFLGVLLIVQPGGADFSRYSFAALGAVALVTVRDLTVRRMSRRVPSILIAFLAAVCVTTGAGVAAIFVEWQPLSGKAAIQLGWSTIFVIGGYVFSVAAMRVGEISFVAPFRYTSLLVALLLGFAVFAEIPSSWTVAGAVLVVATGLFTLYREARLRRSTQRAAANKDRI